MLRKYLLLTALLIAASCTSEKHFISDRQYRETIEKDFEARKAELEKSGIFKLFDTTMTTNEREALEFLYAYSPLSDIMLHRGKFWLDNVKLTFETRKAVKWGETIPEEIFRHVVLPLRSNNESLDSARIIFNKELMPRVKEFTSMADAALEVNHWCHEKANYQPTDGRTASPLAIVKRTYGRCGEESVFTVTALRAVGIPARQIYTPRWAHCDDNHAWVEVWADGKWQFLGACEPEPALNMAWFTFPASRGLFMQCKVFGKYKGSEELIRQDPLVALINATPTYTKTCKPEILVTDHSGKPVAGAQVEYKIYNYAEYCTVATIEADNNGIAQLTIGQGDWIIWASNGDKFGFQKINPEGKERINIALSYSKGSQIDTTFNIVPPAGDEILIQVNESQREKNDLRLAAEDSIRTNFAKGFVKQHPLFKESILLEKAYGNSGELIKFIEQINNSSPELLPMAKSLLAAITPKDLQDAPAEVLYSHLIEWSKSTATPQTSDSFTAKYIVSPRLSTEVLTAWRPSINSWLKEEKIIYRGIGYEKEATEALIKSMDKIKTDDNTGRGDVLMTPESVAKAMITDKQSKDLFFVAACRDLNIPARLNPIDNKPQYFCYMENIPNKDKTTANKEGNGVWETVSLSEQKGAETTSSQANGSLIIKCNGGAIENPLYYINFTVSKIENGQAKLLDLGNAAEGDFGPGMRCNAIFKRPVELQAGEYILVTGNRRADGSVVSQVKSFIIKLGERTTIETSIPFANENFKIIGTIDLKRAGIALSKNTTKTVIAIMDNGEPSNHLKRDLDAIKGDLQKHNKVKLNFFVNTGKEALASIAEDLKLNNKTNLPLVVISDKEGNVLFISQGYKIGTGYQIMKYL